MAAILILGFCRNLDVEAEKQLAEEQIHEIDPQGAIGLGSG